MNNIANNTNIDTNMLLYLIEELIKENAGNVIIWDEKSKHMKGKYFYLNIDNIQIGILLGFIMTDNGRVKECLILCFTDPKARVDKSIATSTENLFNAIICKLDGFVIVKDCLPALMKTSIITDEDRIIEFFRSSLLLLVDILREYKRIN